jgi:hypothetical protein
MFIVVAFEFLVTHFYICYVIWYKLNNALLVRDDVTQFCVLTIQNLEDN